MPRRWPIHAALSLAALIAASPSVHAQPAANVADAEPVQLPPPPRRWRIELLGGAGFGDVALSTGESINGYGVGVSPRVAYVFPFHGYAGLRFEHFAGSTSRYEYPGVGNFDYHAWAEWIGGELGAEIGLPHALIRPHIAAGAIMLRRSVGCPSDTTGSYADVQSHTCSVAQNNEQAASATRLALVPGLTMGVRTERFYVLVEPRYYVVRDASSYGIFAGVGLLL
jgi:hypothetical protein